MKQSAPPTTAPELDRESVIAAWKERVARGELTMAALMLALNRKAGDDPQRLRAAAVVLAEVQRPPT